MRHRTQIGTGPNLAPDQFGTKRVKESIWHRTQLGTKSVKETILNHECKKKSIWHRSQFGTKSVKRVNLAPDPIWHQSQFGTGPNLTPRVWKESIWHRIQFGTMSVKRVNLAPDSIWHQECRRGQFGRISQQKMSTEDFLLQSIVFKVQSWGNGNWNQIKC